VNLIDYLTRPFSAPQSAISPKIIVYPKSKEKQENQMSFVTVMEKIGKDIGVAWNDVVKYLPEASALAALLFPGAAGTTAAVVGSVNLIQQTVVTVEQKFKAQGAPSGTGAQKLAQVTAIVGPAVTALLAQEKLTINSTQLNGIINAVVAILNVQPAA
jgi:hypothetical protein